MNVSVVIATCGEQAWSDLAWSCAYPSACPEDPYQIVIEHYPELDVASARNAAARGASGDWLCFLDADDELEPGYLAAMAEANRGWIYPTVEPPATTAPPPLLVPALRRVYPDCREEGPGIPNDGRWPILNECVIGTLIARPTFERLDGFRDLPVYEDYDLFLRAFDDGAALLHVPAAVYRECVNPGGRNSEATRWPDTYTRIWDDHRARVAVGRKGLDA